jgi:hypothetical protein
MAASRDGNQISTSRDLVQLLFAKAQASAAGTVVGAESMCRCTETIIKLAKLELEYAKQCQKAPSLLYLSPCEPDPAGWRPVDVGGLDLMEPEELKKAIAGGEAYLKKIEATIDDLLPGSKTAAKILNAEATYLRAYLLGLRDCLEEK